MERIKSDLPAAVEFFDRLPDSALVDVRTVALVRGVSIATVWRQARKGVFPGPEPSNPGTRSTRWRVGKIRRVGTIHELA